MKLGIFARHRCRHALGLAVVVLAATACGLVGALANAQGNELATAAQRGDLPAVNALLKSGVAVSARTTVPDPMTTALFVAIEGGRLEIVRALLAANADAGAKLTDGTTALIYALSMRQWDVARVLLEAGANVNAANKSGVTALMLAAGDNSPKGLTMVRELLAAHADVDGNFLGGDTALGIASSTGNVEVVQALLAAHSWVNVNIQQHDGKTPLMKASARGRADVVRLLLAAKADVSAVDNDGKTALMLALQNDHLEVAEILRGAIPPRK